jgi:hypothetical protein
VPLGPMIMFKLGPGRNSADVYVTKSFMATLTMEPGEWVRGSALVWPFS